MDMKRTNTKHCGSCGRTFALSEFGHSPGGKMYRRCKHCIALDTRVVLKAPTMLRCKVCDVLKDVGEFHSYTPGAGKQKRNYHICKFCHSSSKKSGPSRDYHLRRHYGISEEAYAVMEEGCGGRCAICGQKNIRAGKECRLCVDHDHDTNVIRGLLCHRCNNAIGLFRDDYRVADRASRYLKHHGTQAKQEAA